MNLNRPANLNFHSLYIYKIYPVSYSIAPRNYYFFFSFLFYFLSIPQRATTKIINLMLHKSRFHKQTHTQTQEWANKKRSLMSLTQKSHIRTKECVTRGKNVKHGYIEKHVNSYLLCHLLFSFFFFCVPIFFFFFFGHKSIIINQWALRQYLIETNLGAWLSMFCSKWLYIMT